MDFATTGKNDLFDNGKVEEKLHGIKRHSNCSATINGKKIDKKVREDNAKTGPAELAEFSEVT